MPLVARARCSHAVHCSPSRATAISQAFSTPEVIRLFAKKQPGQLRERLAALQRESKLGNLSEDAYKGQAVEILSALKKLEESLSAEEEAFLQANMTTAMASFEQASGGVGGEQSAAILSMAGTQVKIAEK